AGIAVIIFAIQLRDLFGLTLAGEEPVEIVPKLAALAEAAGTISPAAAGIGALTVAVVVVLKRLRPTWPGMLIAIVAASAAAALLELPVETIGTRFGGIPRSLPFPALPVLTLDKVLAVLPEAIAFT